MRRVIVLAMVIVGLLISGPVAARAHQGSPAAGLDIPDPAECTIEPRSVESVRALYQDALAVTQAAATATAGATPPAPPVGEPADAETVAAINATFREFVACNNAGDFRRTFAFLSDAKIRENFVIDIAAGTTEEDLVEAAMATPEPLETQHQMPTPVFRVEDSRVLADGRVAMVGPGEVLIFVQDGNRWLIDGQYDLPSDATPTS